MQRQAEEQLTLFPGASHASHSAWPEAARAEPTTVSSGRKCLESFQNSGPLGSLARMLVGSSVWRSELVDLKWKVERLPAMRTRIFTVRYWHSKKKCCSTRSSKTSVRSGTMSRHLLFRLQASERRIDATESQLWLGTPTATHKARTHAFGKGRTPNPAEFAAMLPTPMASDADHGGPNSRDSKGYPKLQAAAMMWATPNTMDYLPQRSPAALLKQATTARKGRTRPANLREQVDPETMRLWPTPTTPNGGRSVAHVEDWRSDRTAYHNGKKVQVDLNAAVKMWPTPRANDAEKRGNIAPDPRNGLPAAVKMYNTPSANDAKNSTLPASQAGRDSLVGDVMRMLPTPNARDWKNATASEWENPKNTRNLNRRIAYDLDGESSPEARNGQLNPRWVEWLMGFPIGWTALNASETRLYRSSSIRSLPPSWKSKARPRNAERG